MPEQDTQPESPLSKKFPLSKVMMEMIEVIEHSVDKEMERDASPKHLARAAVIAVCSVMGGVSIYLPRGDALEKQLRDESLYEDHVKGLKHKELIRKYRVSSQLVYAIINERHALRLESQLRGNE
jgi:Mor family transcriptional regulator